MRKIFFTLIFLNESFLKPLYAQQDWRDSLDYELQAFALKSIIPGFAVTIVDAGNILYKKGFGHADLQDSVRFTDSTINFIASVSKTFLGLSIMKLVEDGKLKLDEPVNNILPYKIINPYYPNVPITVRNLVTHTSTVRDYFDPKDAGESEVFLQEDVKYPLNELPQYFVHNLHDYKLGKQNMSLDEYIRKYTQPGQSWYTKKNFENCPPGTKYEYSNLGATIAARIVEIVSGMSYDAFTRKYIFEPLKMQHTGWFYKDVDSNLVTKIYIVDSPAHPTKLFVHPKYVFPDYPVGSLKTNVNDMNLYLMEMIKGYNGRGKLLNKSSYKILFTPQLTNKYFSKIRDTSDLYDQYNVGVFWAVSASGIRLHNSGSIGVFSFIYFDPKTSSGAFAFCNLPDNSFGQLRDIVYKYQQKIGTSDR